MDACKHTVSHGWASPYTLVIGVEYSKLDPYPSTLDPPQGLSSTYSMLDPLDAPSTLECQPSTPSTPRGVNRSVTQHVNWNVTVTYLLPQQIMVTPHITLKTQQCNLGYPKRTLTHYSQDKTV